jgi:hypothetical protein
MMRTTKIPKPSIKEVNKYLKLWDSLANYRLQEASLNKLFQKTYPTNNDIQDVLIKVSSLNDFYSTNIFDPFTISKHIVSLNIDEKLKNDDLSLVDQIASVKMNNGKKRYFYSFATKYCSHHKQTIYPIYDYHVEKMLCHFQRQDKFSKDGFTSHDLRTYEKYKSILVSFMNYYGLESFDLKQLDQYLWLAGKKYFPRSY